MEKEELFIPLNVKGKFMTAAIADWLKGRVDDYNTAQYTPDASMPLEHAVNFLIGSLDKSCPPDFRRAICIMKLAIKGREAYRDMTSIARPAFEDGDLEICRELVLRAIKESSKSDVKNSNKAFIPLSEETKDDNVADILGMIMDELGGIEKMPDEKYEDMLADFGALLVQWRALEVPKCGNEDAYELVYDLVERCFTYKAYRTALRLSGLLYVADEPKKKPNLAKTFVLLGEVLFELGYMEPAKRCFIFADEDTKGECRRAIPEKYRELFDRETRLEITEDVHKAQKYFYDGIASGKFKGYTLEQTREWRAGKLEIDFTDPEKQRKKIGEKAIKAYEKNKSVEEALAVFTEEPEVYEQAAYLYFLQANDYLDEGDLENALAAIKKAYNSKNGKINGMVLLTFAITLSKMGRYGEANTYIFRAYILFGEEFIADKLGEGALEAIEDYI